MDRMLKYVQKLAATLARSPKVLLVEDEAEEGELSKIALSNQGCTVFWHKSVDDAVGFLRSATDAVDLMFLDLKLQNRSGVDVLKAAKQVCPNVPVVIVTGHARSEDLQDAMKIGYVGIIEKPLTHTNLGEVFKAHKIEL